MRKLTLKEILESRSLKVLKIPTPKKDYTLEPIDFVVSCFVDRVTETKSIEDVRFAAGEMIANAIYYGNNCDPLKKVSLTCSWIDKCFYFVVRDEGRGFDMQKPEYYGAPVPEGSLGIFYTKQRMDCVYNFRDSAAYCIKRMPSKIEIRKPISISKRIQRYFTK